MPTLGKKSIKAQPALADCISNTALSYSSYLQAVHYEGAQ